jgi:energy-coupling factor transport system permease protein
LNTGTLFASRILFLLFASCLLMRTTSPQALTLGLARVLSPLKYLGVPQHRIAKILSLAWNSIPQVWAITRSTIFAAEFKKVRNLRNMLPMLSNLIASLYQNTEPEFAGGSAQREPAAINLVDTDRMQ